MNLSIVGSLQPDRDIPEWLVSLPVPIPRFDEHLLAFDITESAESDSSQVIAPARSLLRLTPSDRKLASGSAFKNYLDSIKIVSARGQGLESPPPPKFGTPFVLMGFLFQGDLLATIRSSSRYLRIVTGEGSMDCK